MASGSTKETAKRAEGAEAGETAKQAAADPSTRGLQSTSRGTTTQPAAPTAKRRIALPPQAAQPHNRLQYSIRRPSNAAGALARRHSPAASDMPGSFAPYSAHAATDQEETL
jgi:hypothetical protein